MVEIGKKLNDLMHDKRMNLKALSDASGLKPSHLSQIRKDKINPSLDAFKKIVLTLGCSADDLLGIE